MHYVGEKYTLYGDYKRNSLHEKYMYEHGICFTSDKKLSGRKTSWSLPTRTCTMFKLLIILETLTHDLHPTRK